MKYIKITPSPHSDYDTYYYNLPDTEKTWTTVLESIEDALESQFINNDEKLVGIKVEMEIVDSLPEDICED